MPLLLFEKLFDWIKLQLEKKKDRFGKLTEIIEKASLNKTPKLHLPIFHLLIVDRQVAFNLNRRFKTHHYYSEVWELVNNISLVQNYT